VESESIEGGNCSSSSGTALLGLVEHAIDFARQTHGKRRRSVATYWLIFEGSLSGIAVRCPRKINGRAFPTEMS
jgi:hypothetical protein